VKRIYAAGSAFIVMAWLSGCGNPLGGDQSSDIGSNYRPGLQASDFTLDIPFTNGTDASYVLSDASRVQIEGNVARLTPSDQTDNDGTSTHFGGATMTGVQWDSSNAYVRLNTTTNNAELDPSWTPQWSSLVGYWKMENGWSDSSGNGNNGTAANGATFSTVAKIGSESSSFDGVDDVVSMATPSASKITIVAWINASGSGNSFYSRIADLPGYIFFLGTNTSNTNDNFTMKFGSNRSTTQGVWNTNPHTIAYNKWSHITVVYDSSSTANSPAFYIDGRLVSTTLQVGPVGTQISNNGTGYIGNRSALDRSWQGLIDDLAIWDTALTSAEIQAIYQRQSAKYSGQLTSRVMDGLATVQSWASLSSTSTLPFYKELPSSSESSASYSSLGGNLNNGLLAYWRFDEVSWIANTAGEVKDGSGRAHHGQAMTGAVASSNGLLGGAASLNGSSGMIVIPDHSDFYPASFTVSGWARIDASVIGGANPKFIFDKGFLADAGYGIEMSEGTGTWKGYLANVHGGRVLDSGVVADSNWHHIVLTYNNAIGAKKLTLYVDGTLKADGSADVDIPANVSTEAPTIGRTAKSSNSASRYFPGEIDEVALWSRALSASEVLELYRRGANRLKHQIRSCSASDCSDQDALATKGWKGPDNTSQTYFSELYNTTSNVLGGTVSTGSPTMTFANFSGSGLSVSTNRYFQYRTILESDDANNLCNYGSGATACSPELQSVSVGPTHYDTTVQTITSKASIGSAYQTLTGFAETLGSNGCSAGVRYALSPDGTNYYYWNSISSSWVASSGTYATASPGTNFSTNITGFPGTAGTGTLQIMTFLKSNGTSACEVDNLQFTGKKY
jgi:hypothetical protein